MNYALMVGMAIVLMLLLLIKKTQVIPFLLFTITINFTKILGFDFDVYFKMLFLVVYVYFAFTLKIKKKYLLHLFFIALILVINMSFAKFDNQYTIVSWVTAIVPLMTGLFTMVISYRDVYKFNIMKSMAYMPLFSIVLGFLLWPLGVVNPLARGNFIGLAGISESTNLAFFCLVAMMASMVLYKQIYIIKYRYLFYLNYIFLICTLTRGGILAGTVIVIYDIFPFIKSSIKNKKRFLIFICAITVCFFPLYFAWEQLIGRMFDATGAINTSGRTDAWKYIISLCKNKYIGNGYGFLKTRTDYQLTFFSAAHNEYVHLYTEIGWIGLLIFFISIIDIFKNKIQENTKMKTLYLLYLSSFLIYSIFDNTLTNYCFWLPFTLVLTCLNSNFGKVILMKKN